jgi:hydroxyacid-oxoacid transhydrogenase
VSPTAETVFTYGSPALKFGPGAADEIGFDLIRYGARRVLIVTDPGVAATGAPNRVADRIAGYGVGCVVFDGVHVEPTDVSLRQAVEFARDGGSWDAFVAVGGGSSIDTAKAVNLLTTNPGELMEYVNPPVGLGRIPQQPVKPLVAVPTTTGTGSESTAICVLDVLALKVKTGISHDRLRPALAVVDPLLTLTQPAAVTAASGLDILCHALESYTARPYRAFERKQPPQRVPYCGANPVSDMFAERALALLARSFRAAVRDGADLSARTDMALAATFAGLGFGNAGVHVPHANAYPIAGRVTDFHPDGYPGDEPLVPHGMSVALTAPQAFRFTFAALPRRHLRAAEILTEGWSTATGPGPAGDRLRELSGRARSSTGRAGGPARIDAPDRLPAVLLEIIREVGMPNGLAAVGYQDADVPDLVDGAMKQQRLLATAPLPVTPEDVATILRRSMTLW